MLRIMLALSQCVKARCKEVGNNIQNNYNIIVDIGKMTMGFKKNIDI